MMVKYEDVKEDFARKDAEIQELQAQVRLKENERDIAIDKANELMIEVRELRGVAFAGKPLAAIKAEAVREATNKLCIKGDSVVPVNYTMLHNYASQLEQEAE